jgi:hypothetical protein
MCGRYTHRYTWSQIVELVIDQHGEEAAIFAAGRADELLMDGDTDGSAVWRRILAAIEELQRGRREDEAVN